MRRLAAVDPQFAEQWREICSRGIDTNSAVDLAVADILRQVRERGDGAVTEYTERFDQRSPHQGSYEIAHSRLRKAWDGLDAPLQSALLLSAERIRRFHTPQRSQGYEQQGGQLRLRALPLSRVGLYVPGGTALYPSSVLMTAIPAQVAGVQEIIMVTPGASEACLAAAHISGVHRVFEIGGAQAVGALAYGTETIPRVDKIVGPGNQWVASAKKQVYGQVDIDSIAGPSEVLVIADDEAEPSRVAADLLAQAEHDTEARVLLICEDAEVLDKVEVAIADQLASLPRKEIAAKALEHAALIVVPSLQRAFELSNEYAPEHLELAIRDAESYVGQLHNAGAIFVGHYTPEAAGDYSAGPNHVLPTGGAARYASPLGVYDFMKFQSVLSLSRDTLRELCEPICEIAEVEGLHAHARSVSIRFDGEEERKRPVDDA